MYDKVQTNLNFVEREKEILDFWNDHDIFKKSIQNRKGAEVFTFFDGPPTANGKPHIGHILTRVVKDIIPRYKTMKGYKVLRKAGWDTHGLPVELEIEKKLKISGKPQIEEYGVEPFVKECKNSVFTYESLWKEMSDRVGFWADMDNPYVTFHNNYIESVWWALKNIWDKDLLYKGHKVVPYCPRCGTSLSSHEVAQGYKDVKDKSAFAKFLIKGTKDEYLLAWTTTPWTLPSNVALTVNAKEEYVKVELNCEKYILAKALIGKVFGEDEPKIIETYIGENLKGLEYEPLFDYAKDMVKDKKAYYVVCDSYVTLTDGTGIVHCAPAFGEDDARVGKENDLPFVQLVNEEGKFLDEATEFSGVFVKDADIDIIKKLKTENKLLKAENYEHSYPFCWRCDTPLLYYARNTWFIKMTKMREMLVKNNNTVNWLPENIKQGRFGNFLENVIDWGLSRERYWGTPLPIWECECGHREAIGSISELKEKATDCPNDIELHKPYIDKVHLKCKCGKDMTRVTEVIDCWFDSGCMPFAQWHYPFENKEVFDENFPADFISEAVDQTRGWFYTLMAISTLLFDKAPYKNVIVLGHVQDKDGKKMSKHTGNVVDPWEVLNNQGADAIRWYFYTNSQPWLPNRFYEEAVNEGQRKFMGTFWNTYAFFILYANIDDFDPRKYDMEYDKLAPIDKWILSKLNSLIKFVDEGLNEYKLTETSRAMTDFVDELSNWYVRRSRERFWGKDMTQDKVNAYVTLYTVLINLCKLTAPFTPFIAENIYQNLSKTSLDEKCFESVHLCDFPIYNEKFIDKKLEDDMDIVLSIVVAGRSARNTANIKNRQPIGSMFIKTKYTLDNIFIDIIKDELNIKNVEFKDDISQFTSYSFKPQLKTLGKKYGKLIPKISQYLKENNGISLMNELKGGKICFDIDGQNIELLEDDVLIENAKLDGYVCESDKNVSIVLDTALTDELLEEGYTREIISKIQTMRKEAGYEVLDKINLYYSENDKLKSIIMKNEKQIKDDTLSVSIKNEKSDGYEKKWDINGEKITITISKI